MSPTIRLAGAVLLAGYLRDAITLFVAAGNNPACPGQMGRYPANRSGGMDGTGRHDRAAAGPRRPRNRSR